MAASGLPFTANDVLYGEAGEAWGREGFRPGGFRRAALRPVRRDPAGVTVAGCRVNPRPQQTHLTHETHQPHGPSHRADPSHRTDPRNHTGPSHRTDPS